jgi:hypothetical protein
MGSCCGKSDKDENKKLISSNNPIESLESLRNQTTLNLINKPNQKDYMRLKLIERLLIFYKDDVK